jgi:MerR family mercuric resistance operon transcriptional regulator
MKNLTDSESQMTIGQLAQRSDTAIQTIRYYGRVGLLTPIRRTESNYRVYDPEAIRRLEFIRRAKDIGFSLNDIKALLAMADGTVRRCHEVREFSESRLAKTRSQISRLKAMEKVLAELIDQCATSENITDCPILESLIEAHE